MNLSGSVVPITGGATRVNFAMAEAL